MAEPSISDLFGANSTQDATTITINKSDLAAVGLTANATNTAESLLAAILKHARGALSQSNFDSNLDQSIVIADGFGGFTSRDDGSGAQIPYVQRQLTITFSSVDSGSVNPDDY
ncbi:MAG: hypothetical protein AB8B99_03040 [Phormidesmis sp.]